MSESFLLVTSLFIIFLFLSAFFSGSETALFSLPPSSMHSWKKHHQLGLRLASQLLEHPRKLLITIILGNTVINVSIASLAAVITHNMATRYELSSALVAFLDIIGVTFAILIVSEIIPKVVAVHQPEKFARLIGVPLYLFHLIIYPISFVINFAVMHLQQTVAGNADKQALSDDEIRTLVEVGADKGTLEEDEKEMLTSIFEFGETIVREIMVPRPDMVCLEKDSSYHDVMGVVKKHMFSRMPVFEGQIDNVVGILYVKDLLPYLGRRSTDKFKISSLMHDPYFVPETKKIQELLREFQSEKIHMAVVVDEYGAVQGLVTLEDIIEEIVGEIQDEYDKEETLIQKLTDDSWLCEGKFDLEELEEFLHIRFEVEEEDIESIGGFLLNMLQKIPEQNDFFDYEGFRFIVQQVQGNRIVKIKIEKIKRENDETR